MSILSDLPFKLSDRPGVGGLRGGVMGRVQLMLLDLMRESAGADPGFV